LGGSVGGGRRRRGGGGGGGRSRRCTCRGGGARARAPRAPRSTRRRSCPATNWRVTRRDRPLAQAIGRGFEPCQARGGRLSTALEIVWRDSKFFGCRAP